MGIDKVGALIGEWDNEAMGDISSVPDDAVVELAAIDTMPELPLSAHAIGEVPVLEVTQAEVTQADALGVGVVDEGHIASSFVEPVVSRGAPGDVTMGDESFVSEDLLNTMKAAAAELASFVAAEPQEDFAPHYDMDYGEDFVPV